MSRSSVNNNWNNESIYHYAHADNNSKGDRLDPKNSIAQKIIASKVHKPAGIAALVGTIALTGLGGAAIGGTLLVLGGNWQMAIYIGVGVGIIGVPLAITAIWLAIDSRITAKKLKKTSAKQLPEIDALIRAHKPNKTQKTYDPNALSQWKEDKKELKGLLGS